MKNKIFLFSTFSIICFLSVFTAHAQKIESGQIVYEQIIDYKLDGAFDDPRWESYIADLPGEGRSYHILSFTAQSVLFEEDLSRKEALSKQLSGALRKVNWNKTPKPKVQKIYFDLDKQEKTEQLEFMNRHFRVNVNMESKAWKLKPDRKKVQDYICMGADLQVGEETITAWFSPEIPISAGPAGYYGLPGMILALEKEGNIFLMATSVKLNPEEKFEINKPEVGTKYTAEKFNKIIEEKTEEFNADRKAKRNAKGKTKG